jgi:hypothetical protein
MCTTQAECLCYPVALSYMGPAAHADVLGDGYAPEERVILAEQRRRFAEIAQTEGRRRPAVHNHLACAWCVLPRE